jgi:hypothetical protein
MKECCKTSQTIREPRPWWKRGWVVLAVLVVLIVVASFLQSC